MNKGEEEELVEDYVIRILFFDQCNNGVSTIWFPKVLKILSVFWKFEIIDGGGSFLVFICSFLLEKIFDYESDSYNEFN